MAKKIKIINQSTSPDTQLAIFIDLVLPVVDISTLTGVLGHEPEWLGLRPTNRQGCFVSVWAVAEALDNIGKSDTAKVFKDSIPKYSPRNSTVQNDTILGPSICGLIQLVWLPKDTYEELEE